MLKNQPVSFEAICNQLSQESRVSRNVAFAYLRATHPKPTAQWFSTHLLPLENKNASKNIKLRQFLASYRDVHWLDLHQIAIIGQHLPDLVDNKPGIAERGAKLVALTLAKAKEHERSPFYLEPKYPCTEVELLWQHVHPHGCLAPDTSSRRRCMRCATEVPCESVQNPSHRFSMSVDLNDIPQRVGWYCTLHVEHALCSAHLKEHIESAMQRSDVVCWSPLICPGSGCKCPISLPSRIFSLFPDIDHSHLTIYSQSIRHTWRQEQYAQLRSSVSLPPSKSATNWLYTQVHILHRSFPDCLRDHPSIANVVAEYISHLFARLCTPPCPACGAVAPSDAEKTKQECLSCGVTFCRGCCRVMLRGDSDLDLRVGHALRCQNRGDMFVVAAPTAQNADAHHECPLLMQDLPPVEQRLERLLLPLCQGLACCGPDVVAQVLKSQVLNSCHLSPLLKQGQSPVVRLLELLLTSPMSAPAGPAIPPLLHQLARGGLLGVHREAGIHSLMIQFGQWKYDLTGNAPHDYISSILPSLITDPRNGALLIAEPEVESRHLIVQIQYTWLPQDLCGTMSRLQLVEDALWSVFYDGTRPLLVVNDENNDTMRIILPRTRCVNADEVVEVCAVAMANVLGRIAVVSRRKLLTNISCPSRLVIHGGERWRVIRSCCLETTPTSSAQIVQLMTAFASAGHVLEHWMTSASYPLADAFSTDSADSQLVPVLKRDRDLANCCRPRRSILPHLDDRSTAIWWTMWCLVRGEDVTDPTVAQNPFATIDTSWPEEYRGLLLLDVRSYVEPETPSTRPGELPGLKKVTTKPVQSYLIRTWGSRYCHASRLVHSDCHPYFIVEVFPNHSFIKQFCMNPLCTERFRQWGQTFDMKLYARVHEFLRGERVFPWESRQSSGAVPPPPPVAGVEHFVTHDKSNVLKQVEQLQKMLSQRKESIRQAMDRKAKCIDNADTLVSKPRSVTQSWNVDQIPRGYLKWAEPFLYSSIEQVPTWNYRASVNPVGTKKRGRVTGYEGYGIDESEPKRLKLDL